LMTAPSPWLARAGAVGPPLTSSPFRTCPPTNSIQGEDLLSSTYGSPPFLFPTVCPFTLDPSAWFWLSRSFACVGLVSHPRDTRSKEFSSASLFFFDVSPLSGCPFGPYSSGERKISQPAKMKIPPLMRLEWAPQSYFRFPVQRSIRLHQAVARWPRFGVQFNGRLPLGFWGPRREEFRIGLFFYALSRIPAPCPFSYLLRPSFFLLPS